MAANNTSRERTARCQYSFDADGGTVGTITPTITESIPSGAIIKAVQVDCTSACTSGGAATVAITGGGLTLVAADTLGNHYINATNKRTMTLAVSGNNTLLKATSTADIKVVIAVANLTAGVLNLYVDYIYD